MLLKNIYGGGDYLVGTLFLYFMVTYIAAYESLWKSKEKVEPKESLKRLGCIIAWPFWLLVITVRYFKDKMK